MNLADGKDVVPPQKFIPGGGKPYALNLYNGVIYTATAQGCGGLTNAFYSFDLASRRASAFIPAGGGLWGRRGAAIDPEGRVFLGTGDAKFDPLNRRLGNGIVAVKLDANKQLQLVDYFGAPNANWLWRRDLDVNTTPMAFDAQDGSSSSAPARSAGCGCSIATRSAARIIGRRCTPRRSSATTRRRSMPRASGARSAHGRTRRGRSGCWRRSGGR